MTFRQIFITTILIMTFLTSWAQDTITTISFTECDRLEYSKYEPTFDRDLNFTNEQISNWLNKNSPNKTVNAEAGFYLIFDSKKGVCCKVLTMTHSSKKNTEESVTLIHKLAQYPEFKQLAKKSLKPKILGGELSFDKTKKEYKIKLIPTFD